VYGRPRARREIQFKGRAGVMGAVAPSHNNLLCDTAAAHINQNVPSSPSVYISYAYVKALPLKQKASALIMTRPRLFNSFHQVTQLFLFMG
jgi:hypothetical protein